MPTHQSIGGATDDELLQRLVKSHPVRFGEAFWRFFDAQVAPHLPPHPTMIDLGCGPGLFVRDLARRYPGATLFGYDVTPAMIAYGRELASADARTTLVLHDVATQPLPQPAGTVHLVSMSSVLHVFDEPLPVLAEIRRLLAPGGIFLLHDWVRQPLETYLAWRRDTMGEIEGEGQRRGFRLFAAHNKYVPEHWRWLLGKAGFAIRHEGQIRASHLLFVTTRAE